MVFEFGVFLPDDEVIAAHGLWAQVYVDRVTRRPVPIPDAVRAHLEALAVAEPDPGAARPEQPGPGRGAGTRSPTCCCAPGAAPAPTVDGSWARVAPWREGVHAVVAVTGRAMVSGPDDVTDAELAALGVDGWGHAHDPRVMTRLAGERGWVDVLDAVLLAEGTGDPRAVAGRPARPARPPAGAARAADPRRRAASSASRVTTRRC